MKVLMIIDIREGETEKNIVLVSDDPRFIREFGSSKIDCNTKGIFENLSMISSWCENALREHCQFEVRK